MYFLTHFELFGTVPTTNRIGKLLTNLLEPKPVARSLRSAPPLLFAKPTGARA
jgi:hypothetical protein